ncbi:hypothetical protein WA026_009875 [Henosepilachna vigintioctopunctata]|uniref:Uncharacterized protein n=1 Tax=Henosepilachna vigintioctopunctata TaxID=420089 RepID=A0AAW1TUS9_9CUCU
MNESNEFPAIYSLQELSPSRISLQQKNNMRRCEFLASRKRYKEAAIHYEKAAQLRPSDFELAAAAATAMRQAERFDESESWYRRAAEIKPNDARSYTNLGAILHLNGKYSEAASSYRHALKLQPNDATTITNLHKLHSITAT